MPRPASGNAKTVAERVAAFRARQREAGRKLIYVDNTDALLARIAALEEQCHRYRNEIEGLEKHLKLENSIVWKNKVRAMLDSGCWVEIRYLFDQVKSAIPNHEAFRHANRMGKPDREFWGARFDVFKLYLTRLKVETDPPPVNGKRHLNYQTKVRLPRAHGSDEA
jgi:hypothetical protein